MGLFYLDASALVKLVLEERQSDALRTFVEGVDVVAAEIVLAEVPRAVRRATANVTTAETDAALHQTERVLEGCALIPCDADVLRLAGTIAEPLLRSLDTIHVAAAVAASPLDAFVTYDVRQQAAARLAGMRTVAPGV